VKITKTRLIYVLSVALPGLASVWLTAGFSVAPTPSGMLMVALGAVATGVLVNTLLQAPASGSAGGLLHQTTVGATATGPAPAVARQPLRRGR
jgi:hypothetical protein